MFGIEQNDKVVDELTQKLEELNCVYRVKRNYEKRIGIAIKSTEG